MWKKKVVKEMDQYYEGHFKLKTQNGEDCIRLKGSIIFRNPKYGVADWIFSGKNANGSESISLKEAKKFCILETPNGFSVKVVLTNVGTAGIRGTSTGGPITGTNMND